MIVSSIGVNATGVRLCLIEVVSNVCVNGVVSASVSVNLFPKVNLTARRPSCRTVLRHHPEGGEIARMRRSAQSSFYATVCEVHLACAFHGTAYHVHVAFLVDVVGYAACHEIAVLDVSRAFLTLFGLRCEAFPCGILA